MRLTGRQHAHIYITLDIESILEALPEGVEIIDAKDIEAEIIIQKDITGTFYRGNREEPDEIDIDDELMSADISDSIRTRFPMLEVSAKISDIEFD